MNKNNLVRILVLYFQIIMAKMQNYICNEQTFLLCFLGRFAARIVVRLLVVDLEAGKQRVLEADVHADHVEHDGVGLVGLQRGRDGQTGLSVPKM